MITGVVEESGWLHMSVSDAYDGVAQDSFHVTVMQQEYGRKTNRTSDDEFDIPTPPPPSR